MGILRLLLALAVVIDHAPSRLRGVFLGGEVAVQGFFIISGFYMAMVLDRRYNFKGATVLFYQQRYLRLAPMYWLTLAITLVAAGAHTVMLHRLSKMIDHWVLYGRQLSPWTLCVLVGSQLTMVGMDVLTFCRLTGSPLHFAYTGLLGPPMAVTSFRLVPQAWSLSSELLFYAMAPWLVRRSTRLLVALVGGSFALRIGAAVWLGLWDGPWRNRCFLFEVGLFLIGALSYRWLDDAERLVRRSPRWCCAAALALFASICVHELMRLPTVWGDWIFLACVAVMTPILFAATQSWRADRWVGELSYPLYLLHWIVIFTLFPVMDRATGLMKECLCVGVPLMVAIAGQLLLESRFDAMRHRIFRVKAAALAGAGPEGGRFERKA